MIRRGAQAIAAIGSLALCTPAAWADVVAARTGGVTFLRGGIERRHGNVPMVSPRMITGGLTAAVVDRAVPFIGMPGALHQLVAHVAPARPPQQSLQAMQAVLPLVARTAADIRIDPALLMAVIHAESGFNAAALSPKGAVGLMQLMPATAGRYGSADPRDPAFNVRAGAAHLQYLIGRYGNLSLALAAYNAGEGAVERHGMRVPPYTETQQYVPRVMSLYRGYQSSMPGDGLAMLAQESTQQEKR